MRFLCVISVRFVSARFLGLKFGAILPNIRFGSVRRYFRELGFGSVRFGFISSDQHSAEVRFGIFPNNSIRFGSVRQRFLLTLGSVRFGSARTKRRSFGEIRPNIRFGSVRCDRGVVGSA